MSVKRNYLYNIIYQIVTLIIPLITVPYISRVLGSNGVGINAYTNSIIQYFILFGTIGISLYGNRTVAYVRDSKKELSQAFWGIFLLKVSTTSVVYFIFLLLLRIIDSYHTIFLIQSIFIIAAMVDISWLYMGLEDFKKTVIRNLAVRIIGVIFIFVFVHSAEDLWKFVLILSLSELMGQLTLWFYLPKMVDKIRVNWKEILKHLKPSLYLFIPQIAIQIYVVLNKTMLGYLANINEVGFFDNSDKIIKMVLAVVTAMGVVMLPRVANTFAKGEMKKVKEYLYQSFDFASYLSIPMMFGLAGIATELTHWFFGSGFTKTGELIIVISPIIVLIAWSNVIGQQYLMPVGKVRAFTFSVSVGAILNFIFNLILIKNYQSIGTAISTLIAEFAVTIVQLYLVRHEFETKKLFRDFWKYFISGLFMYSFLRIIGGVLGSGVITTALQVSIGISIYITILILLKSEMNRKIILNILSFRNKISNKYH